MPCLIKQLQPTLSNGFSHAMGFWRHRLLASAQGGRRGRREDVNHGRGHLDLSSMPTQYSVHFRRAVAGTVAENCDEPMLGRQSRSTCYVSANAACPTA